MFPTQAAVFAVGQVLYTNLKKQDVYSKACYLITESFESICPYRLNLLRVISVASLSR